MTAAGSGTPAGATAGGGAGGLPVALTVAGSDSGGGAGLQADLLTFAAHGVFGTTAVTCVTAQNPSSVSAVEPVPVAVVLAQMEQVFSFFRPAALKTGMLYNAATVGAVATFLEAHPGPAAVVDPVMVASSGASLLEPAAVEAYKEALLPRAALITPNLDEVDVLLGKRPTSHEAVIGAAAELAATYATPALVKGGHLEGDSVVDVLATPEGGCEVFEAARVDGVDTHGGGCTLAAAITARLARGETLSRAVRGAHAYLRRGLQQPLSVAGRRFISHAV